VQSLAWLVASGVLQQPLAAVATPVGPVLAPALAVSDTGQRRRPRAVEYSNFYTTRLTIHRYASYATLPLFVAEYALGRSLYNQSPDSTSSSLRSAHGAVAIGIAGLFGVNTVTGGWNLWDARKDPAGAPGATSTQRSCSCPMPDSSRPERLRQATTPWTRTAAARTGRSPSRR